MCIFHRKVCRASVILKVNVITSEILKRKNHTFRIIILIVLKKLIDWKYGIWFLISKVRSILLSFSFEIVYNWIISNQFKKVIPCSISYFFIICSSCNSRTLEIMTNRYHSTCYRISILKRTLLIILINVLWIIIDSFELKRKAKILSAV